jgi:hypothetical protein
MIGSEWAAGSQGAGTYAGASRCRPSSRRPADMAPPSRYVDVFQLLDGGLRDGGWMGEA